jgi:hypothetical protein
MGGRDNGDDTVAVTDFDHVDANNLGSAILTKPDPLAGLDKLAAQVRGADISIARRSHRSDGRRPSSAAAWIDDRARLLGIGSSISSIEPLISANKAATVLRSPWVMV